MKTQTAIRLWPLSRWIAMPVNQLYKGSYNKAALQAAQDLADQVGKIGSAKSQEQTGSTLLQMLQITEQPQLLVMAEIDNICVDINNCDADAQAVKATRTVAVYKYDDTTELFSLYDPNFPGEENTIKWTKADGFTNWSKSKSTSTQYNAFGFASSNTAFSTKTLRDLADKAKTELADTSVKTPDIEITEPVAGRAGHKVKLTVTGASCGQGAHGGYVYLDAEE